MRFIRMKNTIAKHPPDNCNSKINKKTVEYDIQVGMNKTEVIRTKKINNNEAIRKKESK